MQSIMCMWTVNKVFWKVQHTPVPFLRSYSNLLQKHPSFSRPQAYDYTLTFQDEPLSYWRLEEHPQHLEYFTPLSMNSFSASQWYFQNRATHAEKAKYTIVLSIWIPVFINNRQYKNAHMYHGKKQPSVKCSRQASIVYQPCETWLPV